MILIHVSVGVQHNELVVGVRKKNCFAVLWADVQWNPRRWKNNMEKRYVAFEWAIKRMLSTFYKFLFLQKNTLRVTQIPPIHEIHI